MTSLRAVFSRMVDIFIEIKSSHEQFPRVRHTCQDSSINNELGKEGSVYEHGGIS